ncbi:MAG: glycine cleavage system protein GcvH [Candidatus Bathyarchaeia archaeon]
MRVEEYEIPDNLYYTEEHEWALIEGPDRVRIGITDYAQKTLHEIVFVEAPEEGSHIGRMEPIGTVESVKAVSEVYSPISGRVVAVNGELEMSPELVNQDPYGEGWIAVIEPSDLEGESRGLLTPAQYAEHVRKLLHE